MASYEMHKARAAFIKQYDDKEKRMATYKQIIERVIQRTKADELRWGKTGVRRGCDVYETLVSEGDIGILFEGELVFKEHNGRTRFIIPIEVLDIDGLENVLENEIVASIERQVPFWVVEGLWPKSHGSETL